MSFRYYHTPVAPNTRTVCPICKKAVYSNAGIHPQCAMVASEPGKNARKPIDAVVPTPAKTVADAD